MTPHLTFTVQTPESLGSHPWQSRGESVVKPYEIAVLRDEQGTLVWFHYRFLCREENFKILKNISSMTDLGGS